MNNKQYAVVQTLLCAVTAMFLLTSGVTRLHWVCILPILQGFMTVVKYFGENYE